MSSTEYNRAYDSIPDHYARHLERNRKYKQTDNGKEHHRINEQGRRNRLKKTVLDHYGGKCECCGETHMELLSIDHIDGGGKKHRHSLGGTGRNVYAWLKRNDFPEGFRVLCLNCNHAYGVYGYCPHEIDSGKLTAEKALEIYRVHTGNHMSGATERRL